MDENGRCGWNRVLFSIASSSNPWNEPSSTEYGRLDSSTLTNEAEYGAASWAGEAPDEIDINSSDSEPSFASGDNTCGSDSKGNTQGNARQIVIWARGQLSSVLWSIRLPICSGASVSSS